MQPDTFYERFKNLEVYKSLNEQILNGDTVNIDIRYLVAPKPCSSNYIDAKQNTQEWHDCRNFKITASRLPYLLGLLGKSKFNLFLDTVKNGTAAQARNPP